MKSNIKRMDRNGIEIRIGDVIMNVRPESRKEYKVVDIVGDTIIAKKDDPDVKHLIWDTSMFEIIDITDPIRFLEAVPI